MNRHDKPYGFAIGEEGGNAYSIVPFMVDCPNLSHGMKHVAVEFTHCLTCDGTGQVRNPALEWRCAEYGHVHWSSGILRDSTPYDKDCLLVAVGIKSVELDSLPIRFLTSSGEGKTVAPGEFWHENIDWPNPDPQPVSQKFLDLVASVQSRESDISLEDWYSTRDSACVKRWPECADGEYDPRCCRFPKPCSPLLDP